MYRCNLCNKVLLRQIRDKGAYFIHPETGCKSSGKVLRLIGHAWYELNALKKVYYCVYGIDGSKDEGVIEWSEKRALRRK